VEGEGFVGVGTGALPLQNPGFPENEIALLVHGGENYCLLTIFIDKNYD